MTTHPKGGCFDIFLRAGSLWPLLFSATAEEITTNQTAEVAAAVKPLIAPSTGWVQPPFYDAQSLSLRPDASADQQGEW